ncbi:MAG: class II glutamine amidotransferase [Microscillaceae bacterium]|jgi:amidophosphoribosyltransferase|nr:class II glutamine amidotransferase [Microscillaceae bacterium]
MCGIALIRLRKPFPYYVEKYGSYGYGLQKLYLLMSKQSNRGQNGAGIANLKIDVPPGKRYISRYRSTAEQPIEDLMNRIHDKIGDISKFKLDWRTAERAKQEVAFLGELYLGHLRYGTHGANNLENCHPFLRQSNWRNRNLILAGNFNLTNVDDLFQRLVELGQHPKDQVDTVIAMEKIGHFLDEETQRIYNEYKETKNRQEISQIIDNQLDMRRVLERACKDFDGGYAIAGITGYGASFVARDPHGIRPAYYYADDEIIVVASEKPAIKTAFGIEYADIQEIKPAHALIIEKDGSYAEKQFIQPSEQKTACSFERIYFSRGNDPNIYQERKQLGRLLASQVLEAIEYDLENTIFSYIPNTSESAFLGLTKGVEAYLIQERKKAILNKNLSEEELEKILSFRPRVEKLAIKDVKMRTFIADDSNRDEMVSHVYDTTYEVVRKKIDTVVLIDDSIVRGTTLEKSILRMLDRLNPKKIIIVSSAPQIRYPDCYGIDMSKIGDFIAFRAVKELLQTTGRENLLDDVLDRCEAAIAEGTSHRENFVKALYEPFSDEEISQKISELVGKDIQAEVQVIYQTVENLHLACPNHSGDWYFTGNYPTHGGNRVVNQAFVNFMQGIVIRAY